jgi:hypothetical protein
MKIGYEIYDRFTVKHPLRQSMILTTSFFFLATLPIFFLYIFRFILLTAGIHFKFKRLGFCNLLLIIVPCEQQVLIELAINSGDFW